MSKNIVRKNLTTIGSSRGQSDYLKRVSFSFHEVSMYNEKMLRLMSLLFLNIFLCSAVAWAEGQEAIVTTERAVIYSDVSRQSPLGYLKKGKKIKVGKVSRNKGQVVPVVVNGRVAYISTDDISTVINLEKPGNLEAERFRELSQDEKNEIVSLSYGIYQSVFLKDEAAGVLENLGFSWGTISVKGINIDPGKRVGIGVIFSYASAERATDQIQVKRVDLAIGPVLSIIDTRWTKLRAELYLLTVPYFAYKQASDFDESGYGIGSQAQISLTQFLSRVWGLEFQAGFMGFKTMGLDMPDPYKDYNPTVTGAFLSGGVAARF
jgi:hypothetical protein